MSLIVKISEKYWVYFNKWRLSTSNGSWRLDISNSPISIQFLLPITLFFQFFHQFIISLISISISITNFINQPYNFHNSFGIVTSSIRALDLLHFVLIFVKFNSKDSIGLVPKHYGNYRVYFWNL
jgi:hypothetical protein